MFPPYSYTPLDETAQQIRLLTLHPGTTSAPIQISLDTVELSTANPAPSYEALSYTWGTAYSPFSIQISTSSGYQVLSAAHNLFVALQHLRHESQARVLWIDAICIDQQNIAERSAQVKRMADIYTLASRVVVWLGAEAEDSSLAMSLVDALGSKIEVNWLSRTMGPRSGTEAGELHWADRNAELPYDEQEGLAIARLLGRSWFERLWIWQEIWLAGQTAILVCGHKSILWTTFRNAVFCMIYKPWRAKTPRTSGPRRLIVYNLCRMSEYRFFDFLIYQTAMSKCTDPRDRVFALLSLLDPLEMNMEIEPDYSKNTAEIYKDVFLSYCRRREDLELIQYCELSHESNEMPTWLPNWSKTLVPEGFTSVRASASSKPLFEVVDGQKLRVSGISVACIEKVTRHNLSRDTADINVAAMTEIRKLAAQCSLEDWQVEAFCSTLCCDFFSDRYYPPNINYPNRKQTADFIADLMNNPQLDVRNVSANSSLFLRLAGGFLVGRSVFTTSDGRLGLAPDCAEPGDIVAVLLGCYSVMILRPYKGNTYKVVGAGYCYGYMYGEALLGPLPDSYKAVWQTDDTDGGIWSAHLNLASSVQVEDPRLEALPTGWRLENHDKKHLFNRFMNDDSGETTKKDPRLTAGALQARGIKVQSFECL